MSTPIAPESPYNTGGPPYPAHPTDEGGYGLSILDWFAAHVMTGLAARTDYLVDDLKNTGAQDAYWIAENMVRFRRNMDIVQKPVPVSPPAEQPPDLVMPPDSLLETVVKLG